VRLVLDHPFARLAPWRSARVGARRARELARGIEQTDAREAHGLRDALEPAAYVEHTPAATEGYARGLQVDQEPSTQRPMRWPLSRLRAAYGLADSGRA